MKKVAVIMGSDSDLDIVSKGIAVLDELGIKYEVHIYSAHRTPEEAGKFCSEAKEKGFGVIIAAAGMAAHLAGAAAAQTLLPVIGIPIESGRLGGLDALLSTVQMPSGIPVATVAVNGAKNAALLAAQILAVSDDNLYLKLKNLREKDKNTVKVISSILRLADSLDCNHLQSVQNILLTYDFNKAVLTLNPQVNIIFNKGIKRVFDKKKTLFEEVFKTKIYLEND